MKLLMAILCVVVLTVAAALLTWIGLQGTAGLIVAISIVFALLVFAFYCSL